MKKNTTLMLVESALLIAVGTVLSLFKIDMPMGGGLTICSMLPLAIIGYRYGCKWGLVSGFAYSLLQLVLGLDNVQYATSAVMAIAIVLLDYIIAYTVIGLSGMFKGKIKNGAVALTAGIAVTFALRFLCHFITGVWIWDAMWPNEFGAGGTHMNSFLYSAAYNGWYMAAEVVITAIAAFILYTPLKKHLENVK